MSWTVVFIVAGSLALLIAWSICDFLADDFDKNRVDTDDSERKE